MLVSEIIFAGITYFTIWLYKRLFVTKKYITYFLVGYGSWILYLTVRIVFQVSYLKNEPAFRYTFTDLFLNSLTVVLVYFLFITTCKYFKDGYISQEFEAEKKEQQLTAEINNLKSQIAPHFLFNTLNNLYGLAVEKSDKLPDLMLRLSDLLRHSLYETQKPLIPVSDEICVLKSYINLESVRLEDNLKLQFHNTIPEETPYQIAPLVLIVFMENAFKHSKLVQSAAVNIYIKTMLENDWFSITIKNNYDKENKASTNGIGLINVKRRLDLLYPNQQHELIISKDEIFYSVTLRLQLVKALIHNNGG
ncbi:MAG TPA: histidine kinase [Segetibacter sp.]|jgi:sensor histidine kinase YesM